MIQLQSELRVRLGRHLFLGLRRWIHDSGERSDLNYWTAAVYCGAGVSRHDIAFASTSTTPYFMEEADDDLYFARGLFHVPRAQRAQVLTWIAENEQPNALKGADRTDSTGASHANRDTAAGKPGDESGAPQRTPPYDDDLRELPHAGGSAMPSAGEQGSTLLGAP